MFLFFILAHCLVLPRKRTRQCLGSVVGEWQAVPRVCLQIATAAGAFDALYEKVTDGRGATFDHSIMTYLVNRDGRLAASIDLGTPDSERRRVLDALLAER
jgi:cytochrome oxidase Cu insertion factor (SCO1/SenC/PrrC family)